MMAHKWDQPVNRHVAHSVTCTLCGVFVERVFEGERGVNYNTPLGGERSRGLAPKCPGKITVTEEDPNQLSLLELADDAASEEAITETEDEPNDEDEDEDEAADARADEIASLEDDEADDLATLVEKYEAMNRKALDKLAAGLVKNYKKLSKDALAFELAIKEQQAAAHAA
jgi:hypothetical protein